MFSARHKRVLRCITTEANVLLDFWFGEIESVT